MTRKQIHAGCKVAEAATDGASRSAASPGASSAAAHPAHGMAVSVLVVAALFVLTQLYAAIPLLGPVGAAMKVIQQASGRISGKRYYDGPLP